MDILEQALKYSSLGWKVFPVNKDKRPLTQNGFKDASNKEHKLRRWWTEHPQANVAIATGKDSGIVVLDIDSHKDSSTNSLQELIHQKGTFNQTVVARTGGGGQHIYFKYPPDNQVSSTVNLFGIPGIDIRADGGYVVAPPSMHLSGNRYQWLQDRDPFESVLASCPSFIFNSSRQKTRVHTSHTQDIIPEGFRNASLTSIAGMLRSFGLTYEQILPVLHSQNTLRCQPPLAEGEIETIANHIVEYPPRNTRAASTHNLAYDVLLGFDRTDVGFASMLAHIYLGRIKYNHTRGSWHVWNSHFWKQDLTSQITQLAIESTRLLQQAATELEDLEARTAAIRYSLKLQNKFRLVSGIALLQSNAAVATTHEDWDTDKDTIACLSGVINLTNNTLSEGHPDDLMSKWVPLYYEPKAAAPKWIRFLDEIFQGNQEVIQFVQRAVGYSLTGRIDEQCLFLLIGHGANGKSTFLEILHSLFGTYSYAAPFSTFERNKNSSQSNDIASLMGQRLVTASEPNQGAVFDESRIKSLTGGDKISARFLHQEFFQFHPICKIWVGVNHLPRVKDDSVGFWRRVRRINFNTKFYAPTDTIPPDGKLRDPNILSKLLTELPGIFNWALQGSADWYLHKLAIPETVQTATQMYQQDNDPLYPFIQFSCDLESDFQTPANTLYLEYTRHCEHLSLRKYEILSASRFHERMRAEYTRISDGSQDIYVGLKLKPEIKNKSEGTGTHKKKHTQIRL